MLFIDNKDSVFCIKYLQLNLPLAEAPRKAQRENTERGGLFPVYFARSYQRLRLRQQPGYGDAPVQHSRLAPHVSRQTRSTSTPCTSTATTSSCSKTVAITGTSPSSSPGIFETVRMNATMAGQWLLHCHVHDHLVAGMETTYIVQEQKVSTRSAEADDADPWGDSHARIN